VDPRASLDAVERRKFLTLLGLELWPLSCPAHSQSLYRLRYRSRRGRLRNTIFSEVGRKDLSMQLEEE
jgi:hypothetical protein